MATPKLKSLNFIYDTMNENDIWRFLKLTIIKTLGLGLFVSDIKSRFKAFWYDLLSSSSLTVFCSILKLETNAFKWSKSGMLPRCWSLFCFTQDIIQLLAELLELSSIGSGTNNGYFAPIIPGYLPGHFSIAQWSIVFLLCSLLKISI